MAGKNVAGPIFGFLTLIFCFIWIASLFLKAWSIFWICLILCLISLAIFIGLRYKEFVHFFVSRQLRYGTNVALSILGIIGIAVLVNVIVVQRFDKRVDLTELRLHSLSEQTKQILKTLEKKISIIAFFSDENPQLEVDAKALLELYQHESKLITVSFKNPYIDIQFVNKNIRDGTIIFKTKERQEEVTVVDEQKFTSALLKLIQNKSKKVYFLTGHGEREIEDFNNSGYSTVKTELENQNYAPSSLSLLTEPDIPTDCELLVIAGPKTPLTPNEIGLVEKFLAKNGKLLLLLDPSAAAEDVNNRLVQLIQKWGVVVGNDLVIDQGSHDAERGPIAPAPRFELHKITNEMRYPLAFPYTRSVRPIEEVNAELTVKSFAKTVSATGVSWAETEREDDGKFSSNGYTAAIDVPAPVSIAVAVEQTIDENTETNIEGNHARIVVFGGSQFAMNFFFRTANRDLFLAVVNWLTLEEDLIAIRPPDLPGQALRTMTGQDAGIVQITSIFLIPLLVFIAGMIVWWKRREGGVA